jgi:hypothetical protein
MPLVNGTLTDFGLAPIAALSPVLQFRATAAGVSNLNVLAASIPVEVEPLPNGFFEADLAATDTIHPGGIEYTVTVRYREARTRYVRQELLPWRFAVPAAGGALADLLTVPANPAAVWVGSTAPDNPTPGTWWYNPDTGALTEWSN